jgi:hypothetical protein
MHKVLIVLVIATLCLTGCKSSSSPSASSAAPATQAKTGDPVDQKLQELAGGGATDCGRVKSQTSDQIKTAADCAMDAVKNKRAFHVAYDLPGLTVGVAGNSGGKFNMVQVQQPENPQPGAKPPEVASAPCPAEVRIAQSGRVTCSPPGAMGMPNAGGSPHGGGMPMPPAGTESPHGGGNPKAGSAPAPSKQH